MTRLAPEGLYYRVMMFNDDDFDLSQKPNRHSETHCVFADVKPTM
jgi:hypothetical protein